MEQPIINFFLLYIIYMAAHFIHKQRNLKENENKKNIVPSCGFRYCSETTYLNGWSVEKKRLKIITGYFLKYHSNGVDGYNTNKT